MKLLIYYIRWLKCQKIKLTKKNTELNYLRGNKMNIIEAVAAAKEGKKIRRKSWANDQYIYTFHSDISDCEYLMLNFAYKKNTLLVEEILADDWEIKMDNNNTSLDIDMSGWHWESAVDWNFKSNKKMIEDNKLSTKTIELSPFGIIEINKICKSIELLQDRIALLEKVIMRSGTPELKKEFLKMIKKEMRGD